MNSNMEFHPPLIEGTLIKRYKRFLADVQLKTRSKAKKITVHCANSGSMKTCAEPGWKVMLSDSQNPKRKLRYTWEMVHNGDCWIGINTHRPNAIVAQAILEKKISALKGYAKLSREVPYRNSRIDLLLEDHPKQPPCYVEIKNVTMLHQQDYVFPDAVTERGRKHLLDLIQARQEGYRAVIFYLIQRSDGKKFRPASEIDPRYAETLRKAHEAGVEILPYGTQISPEGIQIRRKVQFSLD